MSSNFYATVGGLAYGLASAVESLSFLGLPGVDWFHYILAGGNLLLMYGFIKQNHDLKKKKIQEQKKKNLGNKAKAFEPVPMKLQE